MTGRRQKILAVAAAAISVALTPTPAGKRFAVVFTFFSLGDILPVKEVVR